MRVMVFGTFDLLHEGHRFLLSEAGKRGAVTVIVARDRNVKRIKALKPMESEEQRREALQRAFPHYDIRLGDPDDFLAPVRDLGPDLILLGYDQKFPPGVKEERLKTYTVNIERISAFHPERFKSSKRRGVQRGSTPA